MKPTKIEDLTKYSSYELCWRIGLDSSGLYEIHEFYSAKEVKELVNHLESKIIKWNSREEMPDLMDGFTSELLVFVTNDLEVLTGHYISSKNDVKNFLTSYPRKSIKQWCYDSELLKTLPEDK